MNNILQGHKYYKIKQNRKNSENLFQNNGKTQRNIIIHRKKTNKLIPSLISNEKNNIPHYNDFNSNLSNDIIRKKNFENLTHFNYDKLLNFTEIEENILFQRPKVKIKMHSLKHNNINKNTISSEKNNSQIKCKVHKITTNISNNNIKILNVSNSKNKNVQKKITNISNVDGNCMIINEENIKQNKDDKSFINYYNIIQESRLQKLSNHLDNLIKDKMQSKYENPHSVVNEDIDYKGKNINKENIIFKKEINRNLTNTNVYRRKIQRKKNYYTGKNAIFNSHSLIKNKLNSHKIKAQKFICRRNAYQNSNDFQLSSKINQSRNCNYNQNNSYLLSSLINEKNKNRKFSGEPKVENDFKSMKTIQNNKINVNNNKNVNKKGNTINYIEIFKSKENNSSKRNNYTDARLKKNYILQTPQTNNLFINSTNIDEFINSKYKNIFNLNNYLGNSENNMNPNKNYLTLYSNNTSEYNTVNTLNNSEKNILKFPNENNLKITTNNIINKKKFLFQNSNLSQEKMHIENDLIEKKLILSGDSKNKKLKNIVTSIEYSYRSYKNSNKYLKDKNIIMSEIDQNGKVKVKVKEMKNSIEKILRENSFNKTKNTIDLSSPQKLNHLTYIKKNQGTHINKIKKHKTANLIVFYPPPLPLQA